MRIKIKQVRESKGISLNELSKVSEVSRSNLQYIESGAVSPTLKTICRIAKALEVNPEELYCCEDE